MRHDRNQTPASTAAVPIDAMRSSIGAWARSPERRVVCASIACFCMRQRIDRGLLLLSHRYGRCRASAISARATAVAWRRAPAAIAAAATSAPMSRRAALHRAVQRTLMAVIGGDQIDLVHGACAHDAALTARRFDVFRRDDAAQRQARSRRRSPGLHRPARLDAPRAQVRRADRAVVTGIRAIAASWRSAPGHRARLPTRYTRRAPTAAVSDAAYRNPRSISATRRLSSGRKISTIALGESASWEPRLEAASSAPFVDDVAHDLLGHVEGIRDELDELAFAEIDLLIEQESPARDHRHEARAVAGVDDEHVLRLARLATSRTRAGESPRGQPRARPPRGPCAAATRGRR